MLRTVLAAAAAVALALPAAAQEAAPPAACVGGTAGGFACSSVDLLSNFTPQQLGAPAAGSCGFYPLCANEVWGWTDPTNNREYALAGLYNGVAFVDVTEPDAPVFLGRLPQPPGVSPSLWRTLRVYQDHLFVGSEANGHGVQVFDLRRLRNVPSPPQTFTQDARYTGNSNAHTLEINVETGFLYVAGGDNFNSAGCSGGGLHIVNIQNPTSPTFAGCFDSEGYTHETQCLVYDGPDTAHAGREICVMYQGHGSASGHDFVIADVTNKSNPFRISGGSYPDLGSEYTHQGWFTEDRRYLLINDEFDSAVPGTRTIVMDVEDLDAPQFAFNYFGPLSTHAHNLYIKGDRAYLSNYQGGLHVLDLSGIDAGQLTEVGYFDTYAQGNSTGYAGQWGNYPFFASGTILANDGHYGLFVLRPTGVATAGGPEPVPGGFSLSAPHPNPATSETRVTLTLAESQHVSAVAFDALGRRVAVLYEGTVAAASPQAIVFDAGVVPPGPYLLRVAGETFSTTARVTIAR